MKNSAEGRTDSLKSQVHYSNTTKFYLGDV